MNRREFLFGAAALSLAFSARAILPELLTREVETVEATFAGRRLRGTSTGQILESLDDGANWDVVARFGDHCAVRAIAEQRDQIYARVQVQGHSFFLRSADARTWRTADLPVLSL